MRSLRELLAPRRAPQERFAQEATFEPDILDPTGELELPAPGSPVAPSFATPRESPPKSERFFMVTTTTSAATGILEKMTEFGINSIKASNLSSQWAYLPDVDEFIPPQIWNAVIRGNGSSVFRARFETPPGLTAFAQPSSLERVMFLVTQELIPLTPGVALKTAATT